LADTPGFIMPGERPESARLAHCRVSRRRPLHRTDSGRSVLAAGTRPHALPLQAATLGDGVGEIFALLPIVGPS